MCISTIYTKHIYIDTCKERERERGGEKYLISVKYRKTSSTLAVPST